MQPNQQDQQSQNPVSQPSDYISPSGANVPEFLHMDPIQEPPKKKKVWLRVAVVAFVLALISLIGYGIYLYTLRMTPEELFGRALGNSMTTSYVSITYSNTDKNEKKYEQTATVDKDISDVKKPKSQIDYKYITNSPNEQYKVKYVIDDKSYYFGNLQAMEQDGKPYLPVGIKNDQWYRFSSVGNDIASVNISSLGAAATPRGLATLQGIVPMGNFDDTERADLMKHIQETSPYQIDDYKDDGTVTEYNVKLDPTAFNKLNQKLADIEGIKKIYLNIQAMKSDETLKITVDKKTEKITQIAFGNNGSTILKTLKYEYPTTLTIDEPTNAITRTEGVRL